MRSVSVFMLPAFKRSYKKMQQNQKNAVNQAIEEIVCNPTLGEVKRGDLAGVLVYKFNCVGQMMLLAYEYDPGTRTLISLGVHENFYRDLKR